MREAPVNTNQKQWKSHVTYPKHFHWSWVFDKFWHGKVPLGLSKFFLSKQIISWQWQVNKLKLVSYFAIFSNFALNAGKYLILDYFCGKWSCHRRNMSVLKSWAYDYINRTKSMICLICQMTVHNYGYFRVLVYFI